MRLYPGTRPGRSAARIASVSTSLDVWKCFNSLLMLCLSSLRYCILEKLELGRLQLSTLASSSSSSSAPPAMTCQLFSIHSSPFLITRVLDYNSSPKSQASFVTHNSGDLPYVRNALPGSWHGGPPSFSQNTPLSRPAFRFSQSASLVFLFLSVLFQQPRGPFAIPST